MQTLSLDVSAMTWGGCTGSVQRLLATTDGVSRAEVGLHPGLATVVADFARVRPTHTAAAIDAPGHADKRRVSPHGLAVAS